MAPKAMADEETVRRLDRDLSVAMGDGGIICYSDSFTEISTAIEIESGEGKSPRFTVTAHWTVGKTRSPETSDLQAHDPFRLKT